ncbi:uncharacterized protein LACBIDRAFT_250934 [Laccaria bicolor S238N-H82]|uniref:Predicted protein n=1 Tax=Laccaria bicolor (strain S238N-H82 / ATCC MYA-4686) TaxID=486041 RepID=B0DFL3_LACBS|nr:uncharacterized protein LACBIDRAFT_250934 [Laccaria bicolor S238N-H82]EDR06886.1 predicted protein [Laccaria bicolor S238N-H82]|eukprot:XP_001882733.1 predicted protein [Laccaria bicolor S238N-H82]
MSTQAPSSSSQLIIPQTAAAGGITITQPPQSATSFYKIAPSNLITFAWNMTSVLATPTHLTVSAVCDNGNTYPVGPTDGIIPGTASSVVWDVYSYQQAHPNTPLAQATYTLNIWDERGPGAARRAGYLQPNSALQFALYTPQAYTPLASGWTCTGCSGAMALAAHPAFIGVLVSFLILFLSGFHLIRSTNNR